MQIQEGMTARRDEPRVSVIMPVYNCEAYLREAIDSVLAQDDEEWELLIVDDASTDSSQEIIQEYAETEPRIRVFVHRENQGPGPARNRAMEEAKGKYIAFLDSDDRWFPEKLSTQIAFMEDHQAALSFASYQAMSEAGELLGAPLAVPAQTTYEELLRSNVIGCLTAMFDVEKVGKHFMSSLRKAEDHGLWLKILKTTPVAHGLNECLGHYRIRKHSLSRNKLKAAYYQWRLYREIEGLPLHRTVPLLCSYTYQGWQKQRRQMSG